MYLSILNQHYFTLKGYFLPKKKNTCDLHSTNLFKGKIILPPIFLQKEKMVRIFCSLKIILYFEE